MYAFGAMGEVYGWDAAFSDMFDSKQDLKTIINRLKALDKQREKDEFKVGELTDHHDMV